MRNTYAVEFLAYRPGCKWEHVETLSELTGREACYVAGQMTIKHRAKYRGTITNGEYRLRPIKVEAECNGK